MKRTIIALWVLALATGAAVAQERWLHVRVQDSDGADDAISINMPLSAIQAFLANSEVDDLRDGRIRLGDLPDVDGLDLHEILLALREAPDSEFVSIRGRDGAVRVAKEDGLLLIHVDEEHGDKVRVKVPLAAVDVLLEGQGEEIDVVRLLDALVVLDGTDLLAVDSDDTRVRIWIDSSHAGEQ